MNRIYTLILFLIGTYAFTQENTFDTILWNMEIYESDTFYTKKPTPGDLEREKGNLKKAIPLYLNTYKSYPEEMDLLYNLACTYALLRKNDSAFYYLNLSTALDTNTWALTDPDFYFLTTDERWTEFENQMVEKIEQRYGKYKNKELTQELWRMKMKDQAFYFHLDIEELKNGFNSPISKALWELKHLINSSNLSRLEEIIEEIGWPKASEVGGTAANGVFLIIQHADLDVQKKYLPLMKAAANSGEAEWSSLALLIDRINMREGKPQIYGSQIVQSKDGNYTVSDLIEPEYVNQRRKEVGLGPIQEYVSMWGIEWTIEQKEK